MAAHWDSFWVVIVLVFGAVFLLSRELLMPMLDGSARARRLLEKRVRELAAAPRQQHASLLRDRYLLQLKPWERNLEAHPWMAQVREWHEQAGLQRPGYQTVLKALVAALVALVAGYVVSQRLGVAIAVGLAAASFPFMQLNRMRQQRIARFEEQLPEVVDVMVRALRAGYPFSEALRTVTTEMDAPARDEFGITFNDINYGGDVRGALLRQAARMPSTTISALVTAVMVQRETGGNLAEILEKIGGVLRSRFRFQRRVRTLSAEGRITAWVLGMTPPVLFVIVSTVNPDYMPMLTRSPMGPQLIGGALVLMAVGILWIRRIMRIEV